MLSRIISKNSTLHSLNRLGAKAFSSQVGLGDISDVTKVHYTEEFDQGLTEDEKKEMKRFDIYRSNPNDP